MAASSKIISLPHVEADHVIESYAKEALGKHDSSTVEAYQRILRHFSTWTADLPGQEKRFALAHLTRTHPNHKKAGER